MPLGDFRSVHLPYCIKRLNDGAFVVLNREYKPLGFNSRAHVNYEDYPICSKLEGLTPAIIKKIAYNGIMNADGYIHLYNDGCIPTRSRANMEKYLQRLEILAKLRITKQK